MAQAVDQDLVDQFADFSVRFSLQGVNRNAKAAWAASMTVAGGVAYVWLGFEGQARDWDAPSTFPLFGDSADSQHGNSPTRIEVIDAAGATESVEAKDWTKLATGIYSVSLGAIAVASTESIRTILAVQKRNPPVSGKISLINGSPATYGEEFIEVEWIAAGVGALPAAGALKALTIENGNIKLKELW